MSKQTKELVEPSIVVFGYMLEEAVRDGWSISELQPVNYFGGLYVVGMERDRDDKEQTGDGEQVGTENAITADEPVQAKRGPKPKAK